MMDTGNWISIFYNFYIPTQMEHKIEFIVISAVEKVCFCFPCNYGTRFYCPDHHNIGMEMFNLKSFQCIHKTRERSQTKASQLGLWHKKLLGMNRRKAACFVSSHETNKKHLQALTKTSVGLTQAETRNIYFAVKFNQKAFHPENVLYQTSRPK